MGDRPKYDLTATDNNGKDHKIGSLWRTSSEHVFRGTMDLEGTGEKVRIKLFTADRPKPQAKTAPGEQPAA